MYLSGVPAESGMVSSIEVADFGLDWIRGSVTNVGHSMLSRPPSCRGIQSSFDRPSESHRFQFEVVLPP